jgi:hypothetical protein
MPAIRRTFSPAMIVACIALAVALGGTGYAAVVLPANAVGTAQLKANAVTGPKVKDGSLTPADFRGGQSPSGDIVVRTERTTANAGVSSVSVPVVCEDGEVAIGGGVSREGGGSGGFVTVSIPLNQQKPFAAPAKDGDTPGGWLTAFAPESITTSFTTVHYAVCMER